MRDKGSSHKPDVRECHCGHTQKDVWRKWSGISYQGRVHNKCSVGRGSRRCIGAVHP